MKLGFIFEVEGPSMSLKALAQALTLMIVALASPLKALVWVYPCICVLDYITGDFMSTIINYLLCEWVCYKYGPWKCNALALLFYESVIIACLVKNLIE